MKIFIAGATGVLGRRAVAGLVAAGHDVAGLARTADKAAGLSAAGATPVTVDLFDPAAVVAAVAGYEVVMNLATNIPTVREGMRAGSWATNDRIRTEGAANLVDGALAGGARRYVQESITFTYPDRGDAFIDETVPIEAQAGVQSVTAAEASAARFTEGGGAGVVLRFGMFYGPDSSHTATMLEAARRRIGLATGAPRGYISSIQTDDAASAVVAALAVPAGIYNVCDEPVTRRVYVRALGAAVGHRLVLYPGRLARFAGPRAATLTRSQRVSNSKFKAASGWSPQYPSVREGWPAVLKSFSTQ
jgi:nucleoside-diphosphate-sugar epimerase